MSFQNWEAALRLLASSTTTPSLVVIDELPYLLEQEPALEGALQRVWDRHLSRSPILFIVIGSDLSTMELLGRHDRPLYQRMREMLIEPFNVGETAAMLNLDAPNAFDAHLVLGGFPKLAETWINAESLQQFLKVQLNESTSPFVVVGERILNAEFPHVLQAREVLEVIGAGNTTFATIAARTGINQGSLSRTLHTLTADKRVISQSRPLCGRRTKELLYSVTDLYLRFWLRFIGPNMDLLLRGRGDLVAKQITEQWSTYRGKAVEPLIRASIEQLLPDPRFGDALHVGSFWNRTGEVEVDLVGSADIEAPANISFLGSVKWRDRSSFSRRDLLELAGARTLVPGGSDAQMVGVSRSGFTTQELDVALSPEDLLSAWKR